MQYHLSYPSVHFYPGKDMNKKYFLQWMIGHDHLARQPCGSIIAAHMWWDTSLGTIVRIDNVHSIIVFNESRTSGWIEPVVARTGVMIIDEPTYIWWQEKEAEWNNA